MLFLFIFSNSILYETSSDKKTLYISGYEENLTKEGVAANSSVNILESVVVSGIIYEVGSSSFENYVQIKSVVFPIGVKYLRSRCFCQCYKLNHVEFKEGLLQVEDDAFYCCSSLNSIKLPTSLTKIYNCFSACYSLTKFSFFGEPGKYSTNEEQSMILEGTVAWCGACGVTNMLFPSNITKVNYRFLFGCNCRTLDFNKTKDLIYISDEAFRNSQITSVTFPKGIEHIGSNIFMFNDHIDYMYIPNTLTSYGESIFEVIPKVLVIEKGCKCLREENGIVYNGDYSKILIMPTNLEEFHIPVTLVDVSLSLIRASKNMSNLTIDYGHPKYDDYLNVIYSNDFSTLICIPGGIRHVKVIWNCTTLEHSSFASANLNSLTFETPTLSTIKQAFTNSVLNFDFVIPEGPKSIYIYCFTSATVPYIEFPSSIETANRYIGNGMTVKCINMSKCIKLKYLPEFSFQSCKGLNQIILPPLLETIGKNAFAYDSNIVELDIPSEVSSISDSAFAYCKGIQRLTFHTKKLVKIGANAFTGLPITDLYIPSSVTTLMQNCFAECFNLKYVNLGGKPSLEELQSGVFRLTLIEDLFLGEKLKKLPSGAFAEMDHLMNISVNSPDYKSKDGILYSRDFETLVAFPGGRTEYDIDPSVVRFGANAFFKCINLKLINSGNEVRLKEIGSDTFLGCSNLSSIEIPSTVKTISSGAFKECTSLQNVTFSDGSEVTTLQSGAFSECWSLKSISFEGRSKLETISDSVFENAINLVSFFVPDSLKLIGQRAFAGCINLFSIYAMNFTKIGEGAFARCTALSSIKFGPSLESVGDNAFQGCSKLRLISYCGTKTLTNNFFSGCSSQAIAFVTSAYGAETFGGIYISRILDKNCKTPTFVFTTVAKSSIFVFSFVSAIMSREE